MFAALPGGSRPGVKHARSSWRPPRIWELRPPVVPADTRHVARLSSLSREAPWLKPRGVSLLVVLLLRREGGGWTAGLSVHDFGLRGWFSRSHSPCGRASA